MGERDGEGVREGLHQLAAKGAPAARAALVRRRPGRVRVLARAHPRRRLRPDSALGAGRKASGRRRLDRADGRRARLVDHSELLAHHTTEAIALGQASGASPDPELELRAARYLVLAGDRALELDVGAAAARYRQALELLPAGLGGARPHAPEAGRDGAGATGDSRRRGTMPKPPRASSTLPARRGAPHAPTALLGNMYFQLGGADRMRAALERALELLEPLPPGPEHVEIYGRMASLEALSGRSPQLGLEWAEKAVVARGGARAPPRARPRVSVARAHAVRARRPRGNRGPRARARRDVSTSACRSRSRHT